VQGDEESNYGREKTARVEYAGRGQKISWKEGCHTPCPLEHPKGVWASEIQVQEVPSRQRESCYCHRREAGSPYFPDEHKVLGLWFKG